MSERLIVAVDIEGFASHYPREEAIDHLHKVCEALSPLGVSIKINTLARVIGVTAMEFINDQGLLCFLDLKLFETEHTLRNEAAWMAPYAPAILTVSDRIKPGAFKELKRRLPDTLLLPVGPLTDLEDEDFAHFGERDRTTAVMKFFDRVLDLDAEGAICAPNDIELLAQIGGKPDTFTIITPSVRPSWIQEDGDVPHSITPHEAIKRGADAVVVGRSIVNQKNIQAAAERTLEEIHQALLN